MSSDTAAKNRAVMRAAVGRSKVKETPDIFLLHKDHFVPPTGLCRRLLLSYCCRVDESAVRVTDLDLCSLQGADQHVNTGANIHAAAPERRGT